MWVKCSKRGFWTTSEIETFKTGQIIAIMSNWEMFRISQLKQFARHSAFSIHHSPLNSVKHWKLFQQSVRWKCVQLRLCKQHSLTTILGAHTHTGTYTSTHAYKWRLTALPLNFSWSCPLALAHLIVCNALLLIMKECKTTKMYAMCEQAVGVGGGRGIADDALPDSF